MGSVVWNKVQTTGSIILKPTKTMIRSILICSILLSCFSFNEISANSLAQKCRGIMEAARNMGSEETFNLTFDLCARIRLLWFWKPPWICGSSDDLTRAKLNICWNLFGEEEAGRIPRIYKRNFLPSNKWYI